MTDTRWFSTKQVAKRTGLDPFRVLRWAREGYLPNARKVMAGTRHRWIFTEADIKFANQVRFYQSMGFPLSAALAEIEKEN